MRDKLILWKSAANEYEKKNNNKVVIKAHQTYLKVTTFNKAT